MLTSLAEACERGAQVVHVNPLVEAASGRTIVPHDFLRDGDVPRARAPARSNVQPRIGGDLALLRGVAKAVLEDGRRDPTRSTASSSTSTRPGFEEYRAALRRRRRGPSSCASRASTRRRCGEVARLYVAARRTIITWCLGLTQQEHGVDTIREIVNLLLLRGNIGRAGRGPVADPRALERPGQPHLRHQPPPDASEFLDRLAEVCGIDPPREHGLDTVRTIEAMHRGDVKVFVGMGGNFVLAAPDTAAARSRRCAAAS